MRIIIPLFIFTLSVSSLFGQQDSLLRYFKFRNARYQAVFFQANAGGLLSRDDYAAGRVKSNSASGYFSSDYLLVRSTERILLNMSASASIALNTGRSSNSSGTSRGRYFYSYPGFSILNKWFSGKTFTELGAGLHSSFRSSREKADNPVNTFQDREQQYELVVTAGIGCGRLENITDMQNALWLNQALETAGSLSRSLTPAELNDLGRAITKANNTRVLDSRKRTQFMLETVDEFLQAQNLVRRTDIRYFSNLNDILFFAFNDPRLSGTEKFVRVSPAISLDQTKTAQDVPVSETKIHSNSRSVRLATGINRYHPVNLHHQNNYGITLQATWYENDDNEKYYLSGILINQLRLQPILRQAGAEIFFRHAIYPNTRTIVNLTAQSTAGMQRIDRENSGYGSVDLNAAVNYFISYRTRFACSAGATYRSNIYRPGTQYLELLPDKWQAYVNAGLSVAL